MIGASQVMPLLLSACPSFADVWETLEKDTLYVADDGTRLHYLDAGLFADHLVSRYMTGVMDEVQAAFDVVEKLHLDGDGYVKELATIGCGNAPTVTAIDEP